MSRYVVKENISLGNGWAATRGQTVEAEWVEANGVQDYVVGENTKDARQIKADITGRPAEDFETEPKSSRAAAKSTEKQEG